MRTLMVVMLRKRSRDLAYLLDAAWPVHGQAFLLVGAMVALDEPVLLGVLRVAQQHADAQTLTEAYQGRRKVAAARTADKAHVAIQAHHLRQSLPHKQLSHRFQGGLGMKVGAHLRIDEHRGALIHDIEDFAY